MTETYSAALTAILTNMVSFVTGLTGWMTSFLTFVTSHPILLIFVFMVIARFAIGIVKRWLPGRV